ncbi:MAG: aldo/keto reductase [Candidatus Promineifilaceae bacterium]|nr:aldo/keto reductase [Candidatus Promineifilaceae bacterium]
MEIRKLGRSGLLVSELCLGTMIFGEDSDRATPPEVAERMIHSYLDAGGNFIDTANVYADGRSEEIVGRALLGRRDQVVLATKVRHRRGPGPNDDGLSRRHIMAEVENSLRRLQTDYIDLYYAHMWDDLTPIDETLRAFDDLVKAGKVRYIGVSNFTAWQIMKALAVSDAERLARFVAAQYQHSLVVRDIEREFVDLFLAEGLGSVPWGPLGGGFLSGKYRRGDRPDSGRLATTPDQHEEAWARRSTAQNWAVIDAVGAIADARGKSYAQIALNWLLCRREVSSVIIGVRTPEQLADNLGAAGWFLSDEEQAQLNKVAGLDLGYPYRMMANQRRG